MQDMKQLSAKAALPFIKDNMIIGLGGGQSIAYLIQYIRESNKKVKVITPSIITAERCMENGLELLMTYSANHIDVAFDGCNQVDMKLNALKSGGAIHTQEKIVASMADEFILLVDKSKVVSELDFTCPVALEIVSESRGYVKRRLNELGATVMMRSSNAKDGYTMSDNGNPIVDAYFEKVESIERLDDKLKDICGVIETSLFYQIATKVIVADESGINIMER